MFLVLILLEIGLPVLVEKEQMNLYQYCGIYNSRIAEVVDVV